MEGGVISGLYLGHGQGRGCALEEWTVRHTHEIMIVLNRCFSLVAYDG